MALEASISHGVYHISSHMSLAKVNCMVKLIVRGPGMYTPPKEGIASPVIMGEAV